MREYLFFLTGCVVVVIVVMLMVRCEEHRHEANAAVGVRSNSHVQPIESMERDERR